MPLTQASHQMMLNSVFRRLIQENGKGRAESRKEHLSALFSNAMSLLQPWNLLQFLLPPQSSLPFRPYPFLHQLLSCPHRPAVAHVATWHPPQAWLPVCLLSQTCSLLQHQELLSSPCLSLLAVFEAVLLGWSLRAEEKVAICGPASQIHPVQKGGAEQLQPPPRASRQFPPKLNPDNAFPEMADPTWKKPTTKQP